MKIPKRLKKEWHVGQETYSLKYVPSVLGEKNTLGLCDPNEKELQIKVGQTRSQLLRTFIHEIIHAIEDEYDFELDHAHVDKLERGIADFLMMNF